MFLQTVEKSSAGEIEEEEQKSEGNSSHFTVESEALRIAE